MTRRSRPGALFTAALLLAATGCGGGPRAEQFVSDEACAREALEAYLSAWRQGERGATIPGTSPAVSVSDTLRGAGRTLEAFAVLGPVPAETDRCFAVKLTLGSPREEVRERYVVLGLDPIWVFRYPDFEMICHWCHPAQAGEGAAKAR